MIRLIAAIDQKRGIAKGGAQPWKLTDDEKYFSEQTKLYGGNILVGSTTYKTFHGPLKGRTNYVLTRGQDAIDGAVVVNDLKKFLGGFKQKDLWVIGGQAVYEQVMSLGKADELYLTHIDADFNCDQFFPEYENDFKLADISEVHTQNSLNFTYARYTKASG